MILRRLIGVVFSGALAFSAVALRLWSVLPHRVSLWRSAVPRRVASMCGVRDITIGMANITYGSGDVGNSLRGPVPTGRPITGFTGTAAMFW